MFHLVVCTPKEKKSVAINILKNASIYKFIRIMTPISFPFITAFVPFGTYACIIKVLQMPANILKLLSWFFWEMMSY